MKQLFILITLLAYVSTASAQFKQLAEGSRIGGGKGQAGIFLLSNGHTAFVYELSSDKKGFQLEFYNTAYKRIATKPLKPAALSDKDSELMTCNKLGADLLVTFEVTKNDTPFLYRVVYNSETGEMTNMEKIGERGKEPKNAAAARLFGNVPSPGFYFDISPDEKFYAVATMNSFVEDRNKRIELALFNDQHKEIAHSFFKSPQNGKFKYMRYEDMAVSTAGKLFVLAEAENTRSSGGKESDIVLAELAPGSDEAIIHGLEGWKNKEEQWNGVFHYNPVTNKLIYFYERAFRSRSKTCLLTIDAATGKVESDTLIRVDGLEPLYQEHFGRKAHLKLSPQQLRIRKDGSYTIIFEEVIEHRTTSKIGSSTIHEHDSELCELVMLNYDNSGKLSSRYILPKKHYLYNDMRLGFCHGSRPGISRLKDFGKEFNVSLFINSISRPAVLFNDDPENEENIKKGKKLNTIRDTDNCDAFYFPLKGTDLFPPRSYIFRKGTGRGEHFPAYLDIADYDEAGNTLVTLKHENSKSRRLVWLQL
ncbi:hypothetical protein [Chitinophaga cymbidii]|uniref:Uncharacterized protein n=1 Tax=Chitinophaga cymbidii TaxID=1096750 RepID=A0A512RJD7_9BACT|nr:hypothetical protein [Chitinophaga cymbidii]GEP95817.1 hypothetical protein CCY01nite_20770 [Chitinophaga cymbidii]